MLAMDDNVNAYCLNERVVWSFFASMLAPTGLQEHSQDFFCVQNKPSLSGSSYSDGDQPGPFDLPGLPSVGSFSRHSTR